MEITPLISCLCVSTNRPQFLIKAVRSFKAQTYENKELIVVSHHYNETYEQILGSQEFAGLRISYHAVSPGEPVSLGDLRNVSIDKANGDYVCIWDDDDWHHRDRLEMQLRATVENQKNGCIMAYCLLYNAVTKEAYLSYPMLHPATIFCLKSVICESSRYPKMNLGEDLVFFKNLNKKNSLCPLINPGLYIYIYHGTNSWNIDHFDKLFTRSQKLTPENSDHVKKIVEQKYTIEESSALLSSPEFLSKLDFFGWFTMESMQLR